MTCDHVLCSGGPCLIPGNAAPPATSSPRRARAQAIERALYVASFADFLAAAWHVIEPTRSLLPSVAIDAMCAAAQAVADGRIKRLACSTCPGTSKSMVWAIAFPAWALLRSGGTTRAMIGSYSWDFCGRDARRCKDLITSAWYRALVGDAWQIRDDANTRDDYWTTKSGRRMIVSPSGKALGERCTLQVIDDALSGSDVHSPSAKKEAARWISEVLPSRLEDPDNDARVIVGQRLCADDPISVAIDQGWRYLSLPAVLGEGDEPCELLDDAGVLVWRDPRAVGEPLVSLLSTEALARLKLELGPSAFSAQYMQRPHDDAHAIFQRAWFTRRWTELPKKFDRAVITVDASFKAGKSSDFAVVQVWGALGADRFLVEQWRKQAGFTETRDALLEIAGRHPFAKVGIESAANGHAIFDQIRRVIPAVFEIKTNGDSKPSRAASVQAIAASGVVVLPAHAPWVEAWIDEVCEFAPNGRGKDDQVDAFVYGLRELQASTDAMNRWLAMGGSAADHRRGALSDGQRRDLARTGRAMTPVAAEHLRAPPPIAKAQGYVARGADGRPTGNARRTEPRLPSITRK